MTKRIRLAVPASSANVGPGFDTLGIAINLHNYFEMELNGSQNELSGCSGVAPELHEMCMGMCNAAADHFFNRAGFPKATFKIHIESHIPIARGMASSATFRLAILEGLNQLLEANVSDKDIVLWGAELEGCTDNVAACYYGGFTASGVVHDRLVCFHQEVDEQLDFVAVSPTLYVETDKARTVFPDAIPRLEAIHTLNSGILLAMAFATKDYEAMRGLFQDTIHQPYRQANIPALKPLFDVIDAAVSEGAIGAYLSGSGSTMMALTYQNSEAVSQAMADAVSKHDMDSDVRLLKADNQGLTWKWLD